MATSLEGSDFRPALLVVDMQEDFHPPVRLEFFPLSSVVAHVHMILIIRDILIIQRIEWITSGSRRARDHPYHQRSSASPVRAEGGHQGLASTGSHLLRNESLTSGESAVRVNDGHSEPIEPFGNVHDTSMARALRARHVRSEVGT